MRVIKYILILFGSICLLQSCERDNILSENIDSDMFLFATSTQKWGDGKCELEYSGLKQTRSISQNVIPIKGESNLFLEETVGPNFGDFKTITTNSNRVTRAQCKDEVPTDNTFKIVAYYSENGTEKSFFGKDSDNKDIIRDVAFHHRDDENDINYWKLTGTDHVYWKLGSQAITSYAWWPTDLSFNTSTKTFSYEVGTDPLNQTDFLYSYVPPTYYTAHESAPITFNHALTAVQFVMGEGFSANDEDKNPGKVVKIELKNLFYKGVFNPETGTWEVDKTVTRNFTLDIDNPTPMVDNQENVVLNPGVYTLLMLPQNLGENTCEAVFTMEDRRVFRASLNQAGIWEPGAAVSYKLSGKISNGYVVVAYSDEGNYLGGETGSISVCSYQLRGAQPYAQAWKVTGYSIDKGNTWNSPEATVWTGIDPTTGNAMTPVNAWITNRDLSDNTNTDANADSYVTKNLIMEKSVVTSRTGKGADINDKLKRTNKSPNGERIDLSAYDAHGIAFSDNHTESANGYVVDGYGKFKFPAAYGKSIINGNDVASAFNPSNFVNYKGEPVQHGFLYDDVGEHPTSVRVVWEEGAIAGAIKNVSYDTDSKYISFDVDQAYIYQGSAMIGAFDSEGTCMWGWTIWITSLYNNNPDLSVGGYKFLPELFGIAYLGGEQIYGYRTVMLRIQQVDENGDVKVGTSSCRVTVSQGGGDENNVGIDCLYYQWGRYTPRPALYNWCNPSSGLVEWVVPDGFSNTDPNFITPWTASGSQISLADAVRHPELFKQRESATPSYNWCTTTHPNLWNSKITTSTGNETITDYTKTMYDPCPPGYHMPTFANFSGFKSLSATYHTVHGMVCLEFTNVTNTKGQSTTFNFFALGAASQGGFTAYGYKGNYGFLAASTLSGIDWVKAFCMDPNGVTGVSSSAWSGWTVSFGYSLLPVRDY